ncbi:multiheme c-type cytochrome [Sphingomonas sp.]|uniref:multiheme c-type cytochrome n=1 Tax=Sphingomonas sp. TaxID=28214 RepID=UPI002DB685D6|nr:multiheme c-type cytochrome [Sphingomonas sp.]HEU4967383.1 multiheme c-type cytochrome [Sphingomonas sp.]
MSGVIASLRTRAAACLAFCLCLGLTLAALAIAFGSSSSTAEAAGVDSATHLGVASCAGSTCHGRQEGDGKVVRQDEIKLWQEDSSAGGTHSRSLRLISGPRGQAIAARLGIGDPANAPMCLGCHVDPAANRGPHFQKSDGVGCEACHGGAQNWIQTHYTVGASHARNVAQGMIPLDNPKMRAGVCLDCHFGSADAGQFVNHRIMAAGHPRIVFELDLFSTLQQHHNEDADYIRRKGRTDDVRLWATGQAMALERSLTLYSNPGRGTEGVFPEFYFFDCHTCHRRISDEPSARPSNIANPARPIPEGMPAYNDENMIMLSAAARVVAPELGRRFDADAKAFHAALARDRSSAVAAAARLRETAGALADAFARRSFGTAETFAIVDSIASDAISPRFTDYEGSVQAVMAVDTLLNALVNSRAVNGGAVASTRAEINRAYAAVKNPNDYRPLEFRRALGGAVRTIRTLR